MVRPIFRGPWGFGPSILMQGLATGGFSEIPHASAPTGKSVAGSLCFAVFSKFLSRGWHHQS